MESPARHKVFTTQTGILYFIALGWLLSLAAATLYIAWRDDAALGEVVAQNRMDMAAYALAGILSCVLVGILSWSRVEVTPSGVKIQRFAGRLMGTHRFVPYTEMRALEETYSALSRGTVIRITLQTGKVVTLGKQLLNGGDRLLETIQEFREKALPGLPGI